jgi:hypothetical protein
LVKSSLDAFMVGKPASFDTLHHDRPSPLTWVHSLGLSVVILRQGEVANERWASFEGCFKRAGTSRLLLLLLGAVDLAPARRRALTHAIGEREVAAIVDSVVGRGMVTALNWSGISVESFPTSRIRDAIAALEPESGGESVEQCLDLAARLIEGSDLSGQLREKLATASPLREGRRRPLARSAP